MKRIKGFTLIELMIVVAIIAILAAIAISQYQSYVARRQGGDTTGAQSGEYQASTKSSYLVCKSGDGKEVKREPTIPGERWEYEGGAYVTRDANGNPLTVNTAGLSCSVE